VKDHPALAEVLEGIERAAKPLELGAGSGVREAVDVLSAGADALRRIARDLGAAGGVSTGAPEIERFALAADAFAAAAGDADRVLPVQSLFYDDGGPHVVSRAPAPPTTPGQRFRLEVVSQAEHLRALVAEARAAQDVLSRDRVGRALRSALRALRDMADSFGERPVAAFVDASSDAAGRLDALTLGALEEVSVLLANPATRADELARRVQELTRGRGVDSAIAAAMSSGAMAAVAGPAPTAPAEPRAPAEPLPSIEKFLYATQQVPAQGNGSSSAAPAAARRDPTPGTPQRIATPTGRALHQLLEDSIASITRLEQQPLSEPVEVVDDSLVDVDTLLYNGRSALARARELVNELRAAGGSPPPEAVEELLDLLELAGAR